MEITENKIPPSHLSIGPIGVLFLAVFIDLLEFGIIIPLLPFWTLELGATPFIYGILASVYSLMSFTFAPVWGWISDRWGRRPVILAGLFGTVLGLGMLSLAALIFIDSLTIILMSRLVGGAFTAATLPTSQAYIADTTSGQDRAKGFGLLGAAFGLGFALGPGIGGVLSFIGGYALPAVFATVIAIVNFLAAIKYLPESLTEEMRGRRKEIISQGASVKVSLRETLLQNPNVLLTIILFAGVSLAFSKMQATLALLGKVRFGLNESLAGLVFFVVGLVVIITQAGLIIPLSNRFSDTTLITAGIFFLIIGFIGLSTVTSLFEMSLWVIPLAFGSSISNPTIGAFLSKETPKENSGVILGLNQGIGSFMRIGGPLVGTALFELDAAYPYYLGAFILIIGFLIAGILFLKTRSLLKENPCIQCGFQIREGLTVCTRCGFNQRT
ncbi:MAG: MFS transporter [Candidatus Heimdallarchaeota archaeon]|nr:MAG: MFS transporter [Candidatus Heimdallarchaeota archaeon]